MIFETIKKDNTAKITIAFFILLTLLWTFANFTQEIESPYHTWFTNTYGLVALIGGISGLFTAKKWGGFNSVMGRATLFFSLGLLAQEFGQVMYMYYIYIQGIEVPYPSLGDIGYFGSVLLYIYAIWTLGHAAGNKSGLKETSHKIIAFFVPTVMLATAYFFFLQGYEFDWSTPLTVLLDFGYPLTQAFYVSLAIVTYFLSKKLLGGIMRNKVLLILFALVVQFLSDYIFLFQATRGEWYVGGINDYMYLFSYTIMAFALLELKMTADQLNKEN